MHFMDPNNHICPQQALGRLQAHARATLTQAQIRTLRTSATLQAESDAMLALSRLCVSQGGDSEQYVRLLHALHTLRLLSEADNHI